MDNIKNQSTNLQGSRVEPTQMRGEDANTSSTEKDVFFSFWGAERAYFFLHLLNETARCFNRGVFEDNAINKPIPYFKTFFSLMVWIEETNPKAVKWFMIQVFLMICQSDVYIDHPDSSAEKMREYCKDYSKYLKNGVVTQAEEPEE